MGTLLRILERLNMMTDQVCGLATQELDPSIRDQMAKIKGGWEGATTPRWEGGLGENAQSTFFAHLRRPALQHQHLMLKQVLQLANLSQLA